MPPATPPKLAQNRASLEAFLNRDPASSAVAWHRALDMEGEREVFLDGDPPKAVLAIARPPWAEGAAGVALDAVDPRAAKEVISAWPQGQVFFHLSAEWMLPLLEPRIGPWDGGVFWLFELDRQDFTARTRRDVQPLETRWAEHIGKIWDPGWDRASGYIRARIEAGHAYAIYEGGEPVAWAFTHLETPRVSLMGFLHVLEPYRRQGYARAVSSALAKDILDRGKIPALHVKTDNAPSLELTASLGFHRVRTQVFGEGVVP